jgi:hypothetical protein
MGIKGGKNGHNMGFGNLTNLKPIIPTTAATTTTTTTA